MELVFTAAAPDVSRNLGKGEPQYIEWDLYGEGDAGGELIGKAHYMAVVTTPINVQGNMGLFVHEIFEKGEIHVSLGRGLSSNPGGRVGAIIGGTGIYRGVTGEYHLETVGGERHITMKFNSGRN